MKKQLNEKQQLENTTVVHIAPTPFFSNRGCHIRILNEIQGLKQHDIRVILCTYGLGHNLPGLDVRRIFNIPGYTKKEAGFSPYKFFADIFLFFLVLQTVYKEKVSIIHGHLHEGGLIGWAVKVILFWRKISLIMDVQGSLSGELKHYGVFKKHHSLLKAFYFLEKIICRMPDIVICSSPSSKRFVTEICKIDSKRTHILGDVVPDSFFTLRNSDILKAQLDLPLNKKIVIYSGSLLPGKGVDLLLEAMKEVLTTRKDVFFVIVGYPTAWVEGYVMQHNLAGAVKVIGEVPYNLLGDWLSTADLAIDPKSEGSGEASGKILHYMACGLPVVCFYTPNNQQFLEKNCFYSSGETAGQLASTIALALENEILMAQYGERGKRRARAEYSLFSAGAQLKKIYASVASAVD